MAIAKSEVMAKLLRTGDYNVRVTIGKEDYTSDSVYLELTRDSLGGGIITSNDTYNVIMYVVNLDGKETSLRLEVIGRQLMLQIACFIKRSLGIRFDISDGKTVRSWIIAR